MQKDPLDVWSMSEFGGLRKHQNNPACTKSVNCLQNVEVGHSTEEEAEEEEAMMYTDSCKYSLDSCSCCMPKLNYYGHANKAYLVRCTALFGIWLKQETAVT